MKSERWWRVFWDPVSQQADKQSIKWAAMVLIGGAVLAELLSVTLSCSRAIIIDREGLWKLGIQNHEISAWQSHTKLMQLSNAVFIPSVKLPEAIP